MPRTDGSAYLTPRQAGDFIASTVGRDHGRIEVAVLGGHQARAYTFAIVSVGLVILVIFILCTGLVVWLNRERPNSAAALAVATELKETMQAATTLRVEANALLAQTQKQMRTLLQEAEESAKATRSEAGLVRDKAALDLATATAEQAEARLARKAAIEQQRASMRVKQEADDAISHQNRKREELTAMELQICTRAATFEKVIAETAALAEGVEGPGDRVGSVDHYLVVNKPSSNFTR